jgi:hypothetical protein
MSPDIYTLTSKRNVGIHISCHIHRMLLQHRCGNLQLALRRFYYTVLQCRNLIASEHNKCTNPFLSWYRKKFFPPFQWYGGEMPALLEDSSITNKGTAVRKNKYSKFYSLCYTICYATANVCTVTGATVCWFVTDRSGRLLLWVKF